MKSGGDGGVAVKAADNARVKEEIAAVEAVGEVAGVGPMGEEVAPGVVRVGSQGKVWVHGAFLGLAKKRPKRGLQKSPEEPGFAGSESADRRVPIVCHRLPLPLRRCGRCRRRCRLRRTCRPKQV